MRGVVFTGNREIELVNFDDPTPGPDEAVIEIKASGICGSDLKFYRTSPDEALASNFGVASVTELGFEEGRKTIAGHEPCGVVAALGTNVDPRGVSVGDRVMVHHYHGCGFCDLCRTGWTQMCENGAGIFGFTSHGGHAEYMKVPANTLIPLPEELSYSAGAAISCGTGTAYAALVRIDVSARDTVAVFGLGPVGQSAVQFAAALGAEVIAVDVQETRVERAGEFGAAHAINSATTDPVEAIRELTGGRGVTRAVDASGVAAGREAAVRAMRAWGTVAFVGEGGTVTLNVSPEVLRKQLTIVGSWTFSTVGQAECARFVRDHDVDVDKIFTDRWTLDDAAEAYRDFDQQTGGKAVIEL
jgi:(R,R)-butanediol dehydrogenase / meso-butanediol dehydrogenase / diacetyl reductase